MKIGIILLFLLASSCSTHIRSVPFQVSIVPFQIEGLNGMQSFALGQDGGKWLIIGGRKDGLHRRQPWATFDTEGQNNLMFVVDPVRMLS